MRTPIIEEESVVPYSKIELRDFMLSFLENHTCQFTSELLAQLKHHFTTLNANRLPSALSILLGEEAIIHEGQVISDEVHIYAIAHLINNLEE